MILSRRAAKELDNILQREFADIVQWNKGQNFKLHSKIVNRNNIFEIPLINDSIIYAISLHEINSAIVSKILVNSNVVGNKPTFITLLPYFYEQKNSNNLYAVKVKNLFYYMGKGCIMDEDLNPLVTMTLQLNCEQEKNSFIETVRLYIDPKVFIDIIYKPLKLFVDKILLEHYLKNPLSKDTNSLLKSNLRVEVIIKEHMDFFIIPRDYIIDSTEEVTDEQLNNILIENIKDLDQFI